MANCCKAFCVKITYTVILGVIFAAGLLVSFDVYIQSMMFQSNKFKNAAPELKTGCLQEATIKTQIFGIPINQGYYSPVTECFSAYQIKDTTMELFYPYKNGKSTTVYVNSVKNGSYVKTEKTVSCVSTKFVNDDESNSIVYYVSAISSWGGLALGSLLLICVWFCCSDWCRCCCCKEKYHIETVVHQAYV
ncbi:Transmembrane_domain-containing protein [Hexamita inflata]|uniref:Transmembrane domain-containing protein n=1 Tax=Hexamita inflata TaxID=28002 RepID=A0AA86U916_9EUKA|nr:Transmembrane domain-containing protein [Hexamita inflata]CAI9933943.1 Transmembrane domain-containing protein [Hexamita inflata]CAI9968549.1 Transmembrane domain-containing protein [Hexamita inflata]